MDTRYLRNIPAISPEEQEALKHKRVLVLGCGGLGGYIIENLLRLGIGHITAADGDSFDETNLNRQLLSSTENIGAGKAAEAARRARSVNPQVNFTAVPEFFTADNAQRLIRGHDLAIDALDSIEARLLTEEQCGQAGIPLVHGAVNGWLLQVSVIRPGSSILQTLYEAANTPADKSTLPVTAQICAAIQCAEALKLLCGRPSSLETKLLTADLAHMQWETISL